jgi:hypothetical protein
MKTLDVMMRAQVDPLTREVDNVTAVFPSIPATLDQLTMLSYAHIGQHGAAHRDWVRYNTRPATRAEYAPLLRELRGIYSTGDNPVRLRVVKKRTRTHDRAREAELNSIKE